MASNSGIKTLSRNKVLSNYFMYKFMKKNETKKSFGKLLSWRQLWCCCLMLIAGLLLTDRPAFSQATTQANVSLKLKQVTVLDALRELNRQYDRQLMFKREEVEQVKEPVSVDVKKVTLLQAVEACIRGTGLVATDRNGIIVIGPVRKTIPPVSQVIQGIVKDEQGNPLPGATIKIKGTRMGTATDFEGRFQLALAGNAQVLEVSFIGYRTVEVNVQGKKEIEVRLQPDQAEMEEVVVTGFFTKNKQSFTGSVKTISVEEIKAVSNNNLINALAMLTPGLKLVENNQAGANPNNLPEIVIRGTSSLTTEADVNPNQPIIILDGLEITLRDLYDLDINEIERVDVLKDASASALYGERAANGVIVIERKKILNDKLRLSYNLDGTVDFPDLSTYDYLNAADKLEFERRANLYNFENKYDLEEYNRKKLLISKGMDTDWMSKPLRTGYTIGNSIGVSGKGNDMTYRVNANIRNVKGVMKGDYRNTYGISVFLSYHIADKVTVSYQSNYSGVKSKNSPYGTFSDYVTLNPYDSPYDETGALLKKLTWDVNNPLYEAKAGNYDKTSSNTFTNNVNIRWDIMKGLYLTANGSIVSNLSNHEIFTSPTSAVYMSEEDLMKKGQLQESHSKSLNLSGNFVMSYNQPVGDNSLLTVNLGGDIYKDDSKSQNFVGTGFLKPELHSPQYASAYKEDSHPGGSQELTTRAGFFAYLNFILHNKYFVDGTVRRSGSSQFGANNRYAPFWSAGLRWNAEKEEFIKNWGIFDELILRGTYGITGSQGFTPYQSLQMYTYSNLMKTYKSSDVVGTEIYGLGNPDLKWQETENYNVSLDFTMFRNILSAKVEYYEKYTKNTLMDYSMAPSVGFLTMKENLGKISNKGYEVTLRLMPYSNPSKEAYWNIIFTGSHNKSRIEQISNALKVMNEKQMAVADEVENPYETDIADKREKSPLPRYENGYSQTTIWAVRSMGIDPQTGREVFLTRDGRLTNIYSSADQIPVGDTEPKLQGSVSTTFTYKGFSLTLAGQYHFGGQTYNKTLINKVENANLRLNADRRALYSRWQNPGDQVFFKAIDGNIYKTDTKESSRFVMDDNEFYFSTVNLSYRLEGKKYNWMKRAGISSATLGLYMEDICRFSTVKMERGIDYPFSRSVSMSLNVIF